MDYYSTYNYNYDMDPATAVGFGAALGSMFIIILLFAIAIAVIQIIAMWKIFTKAGEEGWKSIIPIYNMVTLFKISNISPWLICVYLLAFIPIVGPLSSLGITIYAALNLSKAFGKSTGFTVGLILVPSIFYLILGFGGSEYQGSTSYVNTNNNSPE